ncbi:Alpha/Beta hydrolase protein [Lobosporangium transversale]|uniref:Alpha/Beta hydrolase protein n=1 Tax=Lobosporangium transversale TaxID=64571 RepID=A0A1Y2GYK6_9FUNG|nr:Alpha/Beta hydrolase protein [Lobosporangium transversale]ORZ26851.1 Alpha/Beta hydrolase protein [Lobosporangium transversale]|eukprot:XP_021884598.1 Alpha/Beta hydrolase protein [Lobosporangium transversale]
MTGLSNEPCFQPNQIVFMGDSAGGGLALSLSLLLRDYGELPQPLTIATWSPWLDLTQSLPSFKENALTDCIPYENFTHIHSVAVDKMFEFEEQKDCHDNNEYNSDEEHGLERGQDNDDDDDDDWELVTADEPLVRQRAQVYCPDSCLRLKYVSPLFETNFKGIPSIFITCGSAERFVNECILMASRLEQQQQPCRIDIHEDMPHIFPLFRFHPSAIAALDRTSAYIREAVKNGSSAMANNISGVGTDHGDVIIPISSTPSSLSSSSANSPLLSPKQHRQQRQQSMNQQVSVLLQSTNNNKSNTISPLGVPIVESDYDLQDKRHEPLHSSAMDRVASLSSSLDISEELLSPTSTARTNHQGLFGSSTSRVGINNKVINRSSSPRILNADDGSVSSSSPSRPPSPGRVERPNQGMTSSRKKTIVNVINLSGVSIMSYHKQVPSQSHQPLQQLQRRQRLTLKDVVTDATLYEWEVLLQQGTIPTRHWPFPPPKKA